MLEYVYTQFSLYFSQGFRMSPVVLVLLVGCCIQSIKIIIDIIRYRTCVLTNFFSSGGFPSFHTGVASSATMLILLHYGVDSYFFAVSLAFSLLFAYDAMNLRYEAGQHARYLNKLTLNIDGLPKHLLKERIGHTPLEVFGGIVFGAGLTFFFYYKFFLV